MFKLFNLIYKLNNTRDYLTHLKLTSRDVLAEKLHPRTNTP